MAKIKKISDKATKGNASTFLEILSIADPFYIDSYKKKYRQMLTKIDAGDSLKDIYLSDNPIYLYEDCPDTMDIFVWLAEETCHCKVLNVTHLRELTNLKTDPLDDMQNIFISAMAFRLESVLGCAIKSGLKYQDLLEIDLKDFNLPDNWIDPVSEKFTDKMDVLKLAIAIAKGLGEHPSRRPSIESVAEALEAPYEVIEEISKQYGGDI